MADEWWVDRQVERWTDRLMVG